MSGNETETSDVKYGVPLFYGEDKKYPEWVRSFKAYCKTKKCKQALA